jgi:hypothetical protein
MIPDRRQGTVQVTATHSLNRAWLGQPGLGMQVGHLVSPVRPGASQTSTPRLSRLQGLMPVMPLRQPLVQGLAARWRWGRVAVMKGLRALEPELAGRIPTFASALPRSGCDNQERPQGTWHPRRVNVTACSYQ